MSEPEQGAPPGAPIDVSDTPSGATVHATVGAASRFPVDGEPIPAPGTYPTALDELRAESRPLLSGVSRDIAEAHRTTVLAWELGAPHMRRAPLSRMARSGRHRPAAEPKPSPAAQKAARRNQRKATRAHDARRTHRAGHVGLFAAITGTPPKTAA